MATLYEESFEADLTGTAVSVSNTSFGSVNGTMTYDNHVRMIGPRQLKIARIGTQVTYGQFSITASSTHYARFYYYAETNPTANDGAIAASYSAGTLRNWLAVTSTGLLQLRNGASTVVATSTRSIVTSGQWRIEWDQTGSTQTVRIYTNPYSTTATETLTGASANLTFNQMRYGLSQHPTSSTVTYWLDQIGGNSTAAPGPYAPTLGNVSSLVDSWRSADYTLWSYFNATVASVVTRNGLNLPFDGTGTVHSLASSSNFTNAGSAVMRVLLPGPTAPSGDHLTFSWSFTAQDSSTNFSWRYITSNDGAGTVTDYLQFVSPSFDSGPVTYNSTTDRWWRVNFTGGNIHFDVSSNGYIWRTLYSAADLTWPTAGLYVTLQTSQTNGWADNVYAYDYGLPPAASGLQALDEDFENGANGATASNANTIFAARNGGASGGIVFDNSTAAVGSQSITVTTAGATAQYLSTSAYSPTISNIYARFYFKASSHPTTTSDWPILSAVDSSNPGTNNAWDVMVDPTGHAVLYRNASPASSSSSVITNGSWWRVEVGISDDNVELRLYTGTNLQTTTATETISGFNAGLFFDSLWFGQPGNPSTTGWTTRLDGFKTGNAWVGPASVTSPPTAVSATDTATGADAATVRAATSATDTAAGTDAAALAASLSGVDTALGSEGAVVAATVSATDTAAGLDASAVASAASSAATDSAGLADSVGSALSSSRSASDDTGLSDAVTTAAAFDRASTDGSGLADSVTTTAAAAASVSDGAGLADSVTASVALTSSVSDGTGLADSVTTATTVAVSASDGAGLADSLASAVGLASTASDSTGLADSVTTAGSFATIPSDGVGLADSLSATTVGAGNQLASDGIGLVDTVTTESVSSRAFTDPVGASDTATTRASFAASSSDGTGLTDTLSVSLGHAASVSDEAGLADSVSTGTSSALAYTVSDGTGLGDTVGVAAAFAPAITDGIGLTDTALTSAVISRTVVDSAGLADSTTRSGDVTLTFDDAVGLTDAVDIEWVILESAGLADSVTLSRLMGALILQDSSGLHERFAAHLPLRIDAVMGTNDDLTAIMK